METQVFAENFISQLLVIGNVTRSEIKSRTR